MNFMRAELCKFEFYKGLAFWMCIYELSFANVNFISAGHFKCEFMRAELSFVNVNFMGAEHCECEFYESEALQM